MIKLSKILSESYNYDISPREIKVFKLLEKNGKEPNDFKGNIIYLNQSVDFPIDESAKISILYKYNYSGDGNYDNLNNSNLITPPDETLDIKQIILGEFFNITPFIFKRKYSYDDMYYNPIVKMEEGGEFIVLSHDESVDMAYQKLERLLEDEEFDFYDLPRNIFNKYVIINQDGLNFIVDDIVKREFKNYENKSDELKQITKESMIEELGFLDEYIDLKENIEWVSSNIESLKKESRLLKNKIDVIYKEIVQNRNYLKNEKNNQLYNELKHEYKLTNDEIIENEIYMDELYMEFEEFENDELFSKKYNTFRKEEVSEDIQSNILEYIYDYGLTVDEAISKGLLIPIDYNSLFFDYIRELNPLRILNYYDEMRYTSVDEINYKDEKYYIINV